MDPIVGRVAAFLNLLVYVIIRWPHGKRMKTLTVSDNRQGRLEVFLLAGATIGTTLLPIVYAISEFPMFAAYPLHPIAFAAGVAAMLVGHWLFYRSHADLGVYWSPTLQVREEHKLVTDGVYKRIRHPMYTAMFVQGIAQLLIIPNWIVGPAWLVTFGLLYVFRVRHEEQMMLDQFGDEYRNYMKHTGRLLPGKAVQE